MFLALWLSALCQGPIEVGRLPIGAPRDPSACVSGPRVAVWWKPAERRAGLEPKRGRGWHSLRRKFASDLMDLPLKVLCDLGGWKGGPDRPAVLPAAFRRCRSDCGR